MSTVEGSLVGQAAARGWWLILLFVGCNRAPIEPPPDLVADLASDMTPSTDGPSCAPPIPAPDAGFCDTTRFSTCCGGPPMVGRLCDQISINCVPSFADACAIQAIAPEFHCEPGCGPNLSCTWNTDVLDAAQYDTLCRLTALPLPPGAIVCQVFL